MINAPKNIFILKQEGKTSIQGQNRLRKINPSSLIGYEMTTFKGQSGCPVVYNGKTIAVHIKSGEKDGK